MDMHQTLADLEELVCNDICDIVEQGSIEPSLYETLGEAVDIIKDIETIKAMASGYDNVENPSITISKYSVPSNTSEKPNRNKLLADMLSHAQNEQEKQVIQRIVNEM